METGRLGTLLLAEGRPRAALRAYERALAASAEPDVDAGWAASVSAAKCIIRLAEAQAGEPGANREERFLAQLPTAREYLSRCRSKMPSDGESPSLLAKCDALRQRTAAAHE